MMLRRRTRDASLPVMADPSPPSLAETNAKLDALAEAVRQMAAGLASGFAVSTQPDRAAATSPVAGPPVAQLSALTDTDAHDAPAASVGARPARLDMAAKHNLDVAGMQLLVRWGGRGLYRQRREACLERSPEFRVFLIEDAALEDLNEAKHMGADLLMDRGGEFPAPPVPA